MCLAEGNDMINTCEILKEYTRYILENIIASRNVCWPVGHLPFAMKEYVHEFSNEIINAFSFGNCIHKCHWWDYRMNEMTDQSTVAVLRNKLDLEIPSAEHQSSTPIPM